MRTKLDVVGKGIWINSLNYLQQLVGAGNNYYFLVSILKYALGFATFGKNFGIVG